MPERRTVPRRSFSYHVRVMDDDTQKTIGHLVEMSPTGVQLETSVPLPLEKDFFLRMELTSDIANTAFIVFSARTKWCRTDKITPNMYHCGFEIMEMLPEDKKIFQTMIERFGKENKPV
jgi:hypothetical protein